MPKVIIIVVWFGKLPSYFDFWQLSCSYNPEITFMVYTDNMDCHSNYKNIVIKRMTIDKFRQLASSAFGFSAKIQTGYKLCDYKVAYGDIFKKDISGYDYWGYCDIDLIFGNISSFIEKPISQKKEKINQMGHFCVYKNNKRMRELYKMPGAKWDYREVYGSAAHYAFDEFSGMCKIVAANNINETTVKSYVDLDRRQKNLRNCSGDNYEKQAFVWNDGRALHLDLGRKIEHEVLYIHFQGRKPVFVKEDNCACYEITNERIIPIRAADDMIPYDRSLIKDSRDRALYYGKKITSFIRMPVVDKVKWMKRKACEYGKN